MTKGKLEAILFLTPRAVFKINSLPKWMVQRGYKVQKGDEFVFADYLVRFGPKTFRHIKTNSNYGIPLRHMTFVGYKAV